MTEAETALLLQEMLQSLGYKAELIDDDAVGSSAAGLKFYIQCYGESIQFRCGLIVDSGRHDWLEFTNAFNTELRFVKIYLEDENSLVAEADWWFDPDEAKHISRFQQALEFWEISLAALKERLRKQHDMLTSAQNAGIE